MVYIFHDTKIEIINEQECACNKFLDLLIVIRDIFHVGNNEEIIVHNIAFYYETERFFITSKNEFGLPVCSFGYIVDFLSQEFRWFELVTCLFQYKNMFFGLFDYDYPFIQSHEEAKINEIITKFESPQKLEILNYPYKTTMGQVGIFPLT